MRNSLRPLLLGLSSVAIVSVTLGGLAVNLRDRSTAAQVRLAEQTERLAAAAAPLLLDSLVVGDLARAEQTVRNLNTESVWSQVRLYESDGHRIILDASPLRLRQSHAPRWLKQLVPVTLAEHRVAIAATPVTYGVLAVTPSVESLENELWTEVRTMIAVTGVLLVTLLGLTHVILVVGLRPVRALAESATRLGHGDLTARMPETRLSEMRPTARAFNSMAASLEQALHEARTRQTRLESLVEISGELSRMQPLDSLLGRIAEACGRIVKTDWVGFRLVDGDELVVAGTLDVGSDMPVRPRLRIGESLAGQVAATGRPLLLRDPANHPSMLPEHSAAMRRLGLPGPPDRPGPDRGPGRRRAQLPDPPGGGLLDRGPRGSPAPSRRTRRSRSRTAGLLHEARRAYDELEHTQGQLRQAQKMEAVGRLAGGVAHDFNNLLTVIIGYSELVLGELGASDPLRGDGHREIRQRRRAPPSLTRQLLAFSRKQVLEPKVLDLNDVVTETAARCSPRLIGEDIELVTRARQPASATSRPTPARSSRCIMNLAVNARDAMPNGGKLTIETANVDRRRRRLAGKMAGLPPGPLRRCSRCRDTGSGMDSRGRSRTSSSRSSPPRSRARAPGSGCRRSTASSSRAAATSAVDSELGRGTTFQIYLPRVERRRRVVPSPLHRACRRRGDHPAGRGRTGVRGLAGAVLRERGYQVLEAAAGGEALRLAEQHASAIHLLLTDVVMPRMSGRELAERLAPLRPDLKVLYMSGYTDDAVVRHGVLGADTAFLQKPFTPVALAQHVRETLDLAGREPAPVV